LVCCGVLLDDELLLDDNDDEYDEDKLLIDEEDTEDDDEEEMELEEELLDELLLELDEEDDDELLLDDDEEELLDEEPGRFCCSLNTTPAHAVPSYTYTFPFDGVTRNCVQPFGTVCVTVRYPPGMPSRCRYPVESLMPDCPLSAWNMNCGTISRRCPYGLNASARTFTQP
jgi:hypothetical protein